MFKKVFAGLIVTMWIECNFLLTPWKRFDIILLLVGEFDAEAIKFAHSRVPFVQIGLSQI